MAFKVIRIDNYNRDTHAQKSVAENLCRSEADAVCSALQENASRSPDDWFKVVDQDHVLWRGMEEFI